MPSEPSDFWEQFGKMPPVIKNDKEKRSPTKGSPREGIPKEIIQIGNNTQIVNMNGAKSSDGGENGEEFVDLWEYFGERFRDLKEENKRNQDSQRMEIMNEFEREFMREVEKLRTCGKAEIDERKVYLENRFQSGIDKVREEAGIFKRTVYAEAERRNKDAEAEMERRIQRNAEENKRAAEEVVQKNEREMQEKLRVQLAEMEKVRWIYEQERKRRVEAEEGMKSNEHLVQKLREEKFVIGQEVEKLTKTNEVLEAEMQNWWDVPEKEEAGRSRRSSVVNSEYGGERGNESERKGKSPIRFDISSVREEEPETRNMNEGAMMMKMVMDQMAKMQEKIEEIGKQKVSGEKKQIYKVRYDVKNSKIRALLNKQRMVQGGMVIKMIDKVENTKLLSKIEKFDTFESTKGFLASVSTATEEEWGADAVLSRDVEKSLVNRIMNISGTFTLGQKRTLWGKAATTPLSEQDPLTWNLRNFEEAIVTKLMASEVSARESYRRLMEDFRYNDKDSILDNAEKLFQFTIGAGEDMNGGEGNTVAAAQRTFVKLCGKLKMPTQWQEDILERCAGEFPAKREWTDFLAPKSFLEQTTDEIMERGQRDKNLNMHVTQAEQPGGGADTTNVPAICPEVKLGELGNGGSKEEECLFTRVNAKGGKKGEGKKGDRKADAGTICYKCYGYGHFSKECQVPDNLAVKIRENMRAKGKGKGGRGKKGKDGKPIGGGFQKREDKFRRPEDQRRVFGGSDKSGKTAEAHVTELVEKLQKILSEDQGNEEKTKGVERNKEDEGVESNAGYLNYISSSRGGYCTWMDKNEGINKETMTEKFCAGSAVWWILLIISMLGLIFGAFGSSGLGERRLALVSNLEKIRNPSYDTAFNGRGTGGRWGFEKYIEELEKVGYKTEAPTRSTVTITEGSSKHAHEFQVRLPCRQGGITFEADFVINDVNKNARVILGNELTTQGLFSQFWAVRDEKLVSVVGSLLDEQKEECEIGEDDMYDLKLFTNFVNFVKEVGPERAKGEIRDLDEMRNVTVQKHMKLGGSLEEIARGEVRRESNMTQSKRKKYFWTRLEKNSDRLRPTSGPDEPRWEKVVEAMAFDQRGTMVARLHKPANTSGIEEYGKRFLELPAESLFTVYVHEDDRKVCGSKELTRQVTEMYAGEASATEDDGDLQFVVRLHDALGGCSMKTLPKALEKVGAMQKITKKKLKNMAMIAVNRSVTKRRYSRRPHSKVASVYGRGLAEWAGVDGLEVEFRGEKFYVLSLVKMYSRWGTGKVCTGIRVSGADMVEFLRSQRRHGIKFHKLILDRGPENRSDAVYQFAKGSQIGLFLVRTHDSRSNGIVERRNIMLREQAGRKNIGREEEAGGRRAKLAEMLQILIDQVNDELNCRPTSMLDGYSPHEVEFGVRSPHLRFIEEGLEEGGSLTDEYMARQEIRESTEKMWHDREFLNKFQKLTERLAGAQKERVTYEIGERVRCAQKKKDEWRFGTVEGVRDTGLSTSYLIKYEGTDGPFQPYHPYGIADLQPAPHPSYLVDLPIELERLDMSGPSIGTSKGTILRSELHPGFDPAIHGMSGEDQEYYRNVLEGAAKLLESKSKKEKTSGLKAVKQLLDDGKEDKTVVEDINTHSIGAEGVKKRKRIQGSREKMTVTEVEREMRDTPGTELMKVKCNPDVHEIKEAVESLFEGQRGLVRKIFIVNAKTRELILKDEGTLESLRNENFTRMDKREKVAIYILLDESEKKKLLAAQNNLIRAGQLEAHNTELTSGNISGYELYGVRYDFEAIERLGREKQVKGVSFGPGSKEFKMIAAASTAGYALQEVILPAGNRVMVKGEKNGDIIADTFKVSKYTVMQGNKNVTGFRVSNAMPAEKVRSFEQVVILKYKKKKMSYAGKKREGPSPEGEWVSRAQIPIWGWRLLRSHGKIADLRPSTVVEWGLGPQGMAALSKEMKSALTKREEEEAAPLSRISRKEAINRRKEEDWISTRVIYDIKIKRDRDEEAYIVVKCRLVPRGFLQKLGIEGREEELNEYASSVSNLASPTLHGGQLRLILGLSAFLRKDGNIWTADVERAFLNSGQYREERKEVLTYPREILKGNEERVAGGYPETKEQDENGDRWMLLTNLSIYGLRDAAIRWSSRFKQILHNVNLWCTGGTPCVYHLENGKKRREEDMGIAGVHVDDLIVGSEQAESTLEKNARRNQVRTDGEHTGRRGDIRGTADCYSKRKGVLMDKDVEQREVPEVGANGTGGEKR